MTTKVEGENRVPESQVRETAMSRLKEALVSQLGVRSREAGLLVGFLDRFSDRPLAVSSSLARNEVSVGLTVADEPLKIELGKEFFRLSRISEKGKTLIYLPDWVIEGSQLRILGSGKRGLVLRFEKQPARQKKMWVGISKDLKGGVDIGLSPDYEVLKMELDL